MPWRRVRGWLRGGREGRGCGRYERRPGSNELRARSLLSASPHAAAHRALARRLNTPSPVSSSFARSVVRSCLGASIALITRAPETNEIDAAAVWLLLLRCLLPLSRSLALASDPRAPARRTVSLCISVALSSRWSISFRSVGCDLFFEAIFLCLESGTRCWFTRDSSRAHTRTRTRRHGQARDHQARQPREVLRAPRPTGRRVHLATSSRLSRSLALSHTPRVCVCVRSRGGVSSSYGSVWRAIKKGTNEEVAIKRVPLDDDVDDLHKEMDVMKECNSPYVVKYHGCYLKGSEELWVRRRERQRARECRLAPLPLLLFILVALDPTACRCFVVDVPSLSHAHLQYPRCWPAAGAA